MAWHINHCQPDNTGLNNGTKRPLKRLTVRGEDGGIHVDRLGTSDHRPVADGEHPPGGRVGVDVAGQT